MGAACGGGPPGLHDSGQVSWLPLRMALPGVNCQCAQFCGTRPKAGEAGLEKVHFTTRAFGSMAGALLGIAKADRLGSKSSLVK